MVVYLGLGLVFLITLGTFTVLQHYLPVNHAVFLSAVIGIVYCGHMVFVTAALLKLLEQQEWIFRALDKTEDEKNEHSV